MVSINMTALGRQKHSKPAADVSLITAFLSSSACVRLTNHYQVRNRNRPPMQQGGCTAQQLSPLCCHTGQTLHNKRYGNLAVLSSLQMHCIHFLYTALWVLITRCYILPRIFCDVNVSPATSSHQTKTRRCLWALFGIFIQVTDHINRRRTSVHQSNLC